jgi:hypothetical protein
VGRSASSFNRHKARFQTQATVLIVCEDTKSGKQYLQDAGQYFRANAHIELTHAGNTDPLGIVRAAKARSKGFDRTICAIDRDTHANFDDATQMARAAGIELVVSYPCFEYWLLLHFVESRKAYVAAGVNSAADLLIRDLREHEDMKGYGKGNAKGLFERLLGDRFSEARTRSPRVLADAVRVGNMNPSTKLHELISVLEALGKLTPT